ncbi:ComEA family DNA-binding protein [Gemmiger sp.]
MQTTRRLAAATLLAMVLIAVGACFLIAPVWQPRHLAAPYTAVAVQTAEPEPTPIDINTATAEELTALPGLGPEKAAALVAYRTEHGPFRTLADAAAVKGISLRMTESWAGLAAAE